MTPAKGGVPASPSGRPPNRVPSGATRVFGVIGLPVAHSLSPALHNAAFAATGIDAVYVALPVPSGRGGDAVRALAVLGLGGVNVTMPHKTDAARACDDRDEDVTALDAVNTVVVRADGTTRGYSTDGLGFLRSLTDAGCDPNGADALVLGAGGAARAVVRALGRAGASVTVAARRADAARAAAALAPGGGVVAFDDAARACAAGVALVVNATPLGMDGTDPLPSLPWRPGQWVADLVYRPEVTPLLAAAAAAGAHPIGGLGMLVHQAALAFELFTGRPAPLSVMRAAVA